MKKLLIYIAMAGATLLTSSCNDWLDVLPKNEQVSPEYWKTKEQVEEVLAQGYQNMRLTVPTLIYWGELRGASIYAYSGKSKQELQNFQLTSSSNECKWASFYSILNVANSIIKYAPEVKRQDETYHEAVMNSNMAGLMLLELLPLGTQKTQMSITLNLFEIVASIPKYEQITQRSNSIFYDRI